MLKYQVIGPDSAGRYLVAYPTPGLKTSFTMACDCPTLESAQDAAEHYNMIQVRREMMIKRERELCGLAGVYPDLENVP